MKNRLENMYELESLMRYVYKVLRNEMNTVYENEMSRNEFFILRALYENGSKKSVDLSKMLNVSASHITAITDSLIDKKWIERIRSDKDRRIVNLHITEEGRNKLELFEKKKTDFLLGKFKDFNDDEIENFIYLFKKLIKE
ncbi:MarR family winged helix-turn-helix transcriptional regulator [Metabacillus malikii]|uniref:DNA-binding MarR family transcriptional regulator n=1 Tax=Metabacillus malikii TaxID=1504265 RepID=A0ABT9Z9E9_9BACI|nr:MarR family transcriptional regulator [Metabacillus malikii]MDQ0228883.1 DNA-binding MarR family transcriptional regulator [Metabacillus malikii]